MCIRDSIANNAAIAFVNNRLMYLFSNVKYFLGTLQIEYFENAGVTTSIHNYLTKSRIYMGDNWFWSPDRETAAANASNIAWRTRNGPVFGLLFSDYLLSFARCRHRCRHSNHSRQLLGTPGARRTK